MQNDCNRRGFALLFSKVMLVIFVLYIDSIYLLHTYNICIYTVYILIMFTLPVKLLGCKLLCLGLGGLFTRMIAFPPFVELR